MTPGLHLISSKQYHSGPGLSSTDIKELLRSPAHYHAYKQTEIEPTPEMLKGSVIHSLILEPESFKKEYAIGDFNIRRGKEYEKVVKDNPDKTIVSRLEMEEAERCVMAFKEQWADNPELQELLEGRKEHSFFWEDERTGALCKTRPDIVTPHGRLVDLKTARDASFDAFQKAVFDLKYFVSAAYQLRGFSATLPHIPVEEMLWMKEPPQHFSFVVIETKPPYLVAIYHLDAKALEIGNHLVDKALDLFSVAVAEDRFVGYSKTSIELPLPNWALWRLNYSGGSL